MPRLLVENQFLYESFCFLRREQALTGQGRITLALIRTYLDLVGPRPVAQYAAYFVRAVREMEDLCVRYRRELETKAEALARGDRSRDAVANRDR